MNSDGTQAARLDPLLADELDRMAFLAESRLLARPEARECDDLARFAAELYGVPIAMVTLIDEQALWVHGRTGLSIECAPRRNSFCAQTIAQDQPLIVHDALHDARFAANPFVTSDPAVRFYAGAAIITRDGIRLGSMCIADHAPHPEFDQQDTKALHRLATLAARRFETLRMRMEERALGGFADATALAILTTDAHGLITSWNAAAEHMFGLNRAKAIGRTMDVIIPPRFHDAHHAGIERIKRGAQSKLVGKTVEVIARRADDSEFPVEISISAWPVSSGVAFGAHMQDISERRAREAALEHTAWFDHLTGFQKSQAFRETLADRLSKKDAVGLIAFDLDGFKAVNESLGHATGDALLQELAVRLQGLSGTGWVIGRIAGDKFGIILPPDADLFSARDAAGALLALFQEVFRVGDHRLHLSASIGLALVPDHADNGDELMLCADLAMFQAKRDGGRAFRLFNASMKAQLSARRSLQEELRQAQIAGQWELYYQPQFSFSDSSLIGAEALLRWRHPIWGILTPITFMPVLETHLVAYEVGNWVLDESCRQLAAWRAAGLAIPRISCNLFAAQVNNGSLVDEVEGALARHGLVPADLELEITETIALNHDDATLAPLFQLVERGLGIALDDFGTGFASLTTLKRAPVTRLKIDRCFVADMCDDRHSAAVIGGILSIGKALDIEVVAEGIETAEQQAALIALGCEQGQGYLHGRPVCEADFTERFMIDVPHQARRHR